jgi:type IV pilus assembly protein PilN
VRFDLVEYNGTDQVTIQGIAASDQDILKLIENLSKQKLIKQASLSSMKLPGGQGAQKGFKIFVKVKGI